MAVHVKLIKNNIKSRKSYGKFFAKAVSQGEVTMHEYGGEMLYINKSKKHPMWAMVEFILSKNRSLLTKMLQ